MDSVGFAMLRHLHHLEGKSMSDAETDSETQAVVLPGKAFSELVLGKAVVVHGGDAILADAIQNVFAGSAEVLLNVWELEKFHWGKMFVSRKFSADGEVTFLLKIRGAGGGPQKDFQIPKNIVMKAVSEDASIIATALMNDLDAMDWIGKSFEQSFAAAVEKAKLAFASRAVKPKKSGSGPLRA